MRPAFKSGRAENAQTLVFFALAFGTIVLLCGLAIDSGLMFLAKARMSRAVDGAALAAVGNFHLSNTPSVNQDDVALVVRNFAAANFTSLSPIGAVASSAHVYPDTTVTTTSGVTDTLYTYNFNDGAKDANGQYKRFVQVIEQTGAGGSITSVTVNARCPVTTYFIGYAGSYFRNLKVSSSAIATRNPRLIEIVLDRSASMLATGGGAYGLPQAVVQFLDFFDTSSDNIGIVSFGSNARVEMPLTTNFIVAGTNALFDAYEYDDNETDDAGFSPAGVPGADPEQFSTNSDYDPNYATTGVRRMKFGGTTAADDGIRLGMEQLMANTGFTDPDVEKYLVLFTDGKWNVARTLLAGPSYTNEVSYPTAAQAAAGALVGNPNVWNSSNLAANTNLFLMPTLSPLPYVTNAIGQSAKGGDFSNYVAQHLHDFWLSADGTANETLDTPSTTIVGGTQTNAVSSTFLGAYGGTNFYSTNVDLWLQPGAVAYYSSTNNAPHGLANPYPYVSNYNNPTQHINIKLYPGDSISLVVPGYLVDGLIYDGLDLPYPSNPDYPMYRSDNYNEPFMWPDDAPFTSSSQINDQEQGNGTPPAVSTSLMRQLMFRNYANLLTGFYVSRPDIPYGLGVEHFITDGPLNPGAYRPLYGLGTFYPGAGFYWPFDTVGLDYDPSYALTNATADPDLTSSGFARKGAYSMNMLSPVATPEWAGEWFYEGTGGTGVVSGLGTTSVSTLMGNKSAWQNGAPGWITADFDNATCTTTDPVHNTNLAVANWRPLSFSGSNDAVAFSAISSSDAANHTGGYVTDGFGNYYRNAMAWSGRPTHYFDFSQGKWIPISNNHAKNLQALPLCNWKAYEYAWHARAMGVTIYTVGYGYLVSTAQQALMAQMANATNTTAGNSQGYNGSGVFYYNPGPGTAINYNPNQPIGQQFFATNVADISNDFYQVGQAINASLTQ